MKITLNNYYFAKIYFKTSRSNFSHSGIFRRLRFNISPGKIEFIAPYKAKADLISFDHHEIVDKKIIENFKGIGLLFDIFTICTEVIVSNYHEGLIYKPDKNILKVFFNKTLGFEDILTKLKNSNLLLSIGTSEDVWPILYSDKSTVKFKDDSIIHMRHLIDRICRSKKINRVTISLLNYWKKGFILKNLCFREESFLNFYKILEYFLGKNIVDQKAVQIIDRFSLEDKNVAKRLIETIIEIRNNWDIAHKNIKKSAGNKRLISRDELFNLSYWDYLWDYHYDLEEISRFLIYKYLNIQSIELKIGKTNSLRTTFKF